MVGQTKNKMKSLLLTTLATAGHILLFMLSRECLDMTGDENFLLFWAMLGLTWMVGISIESTR